MTRTAWTLSVALVSLAAAAEDGHAQLFLHQLPLKTTLRGAIDWNSARLRVSYADEQACKAAFIVRRKLKCSTANGLVLPLAEPTIRDAVQARHRTPSWVMDSNEPAFTAVWNELTATLGSAPSPEALTEFAARTLTNKSYRHGFDIASQVAKHRGGDCTEHAVFLAALFRRAGIPARGMVGSVLIPTDNSPLAMGHMWVEAWHHGSWHIYDAALPATLNAKYLPAGELTNEGPAYTTALVELIGAMSFKELELLSL